MGRSPDAPPATQRAGTGAGPGARVLAAVLRQTSLDLFALAACLVISLALEGATPRQAYIVKSKMRDNNSYPYHDNTVPSWSVPIYAVIGPVVVFALYRAVASRPHYEVYRLSLNFLTAVFLTGAITNAIKVPVGRIRPNFAVKCWPDGAPQVFIDENSIGGYAVCSEGVDEGTLKEVRKSFPSGHSSWSAAGLGYLTLFLMGQLKVYAGDGWGWRFVVSMLPAFGAVATAITRVIDYWHFPSDVITGLVLGFVIAFVLYRQFYPSLTHPECDVPLYVLKKRYAAGGGGTTTAGTTLSPASSGVSPTVAAAVAVVSPNGNASSSSRAVQYQLHEGGIGTASSGTPMELQSMPKGPDAA